MEKHIPKKTIGGWFSDAFPPPEFLNLKITGVDISDRSVKVLSLKKTQEGSIPDFFEQGRISSSTIHQGGIEDPESLIMVLRTLRKKYDMNFIRASLPEEKAYLFQTIIPNSPDKDQIFNSIEFQLEEHVPISSGESIFDYDIVEEHQKVTQSSANDRSGEKCKEINFK